MSQPYFSIDHKHTGFEDLLQLIHKQLSLQLDDAALKKINACRTYLDKKADSGQELFYGINTGFGYLQNIRINNDQLEELQSNLLQSHACGMGDEVPAEIVKLMLVLKIKSLSYGHSGVQAIAVQRLIDMFNHNILPVIYTQGSLGASGDLAPLSHLCLPLIGLGEVYHEGQKIQAATLWKKMGWHPLHLKSKEGLALINGTQFMSAYGIHNLIHSRRLMQWADTIAAISFDAFNCVSSPLHEKIHAVRAHKGQVNTAKKLQELLQGSDIQAAPKSQVQDPYSFRCIPQVHGATKDVLDHVEQVFITEINSVTDNPNIFPDEDLIISGGNFHGQPLAMALDYLSIAMSELASIAERRTYQLISGQHGLPLFLITQPGLHSGFMIPQYTAAGIVSENKQLCTPSSVDSIPSSNNQEDHVSMGANAATKCKRVIDNTEKVLAIELLTAAQAIDFRKPLESSPYIETLLKAFRKTVPFNNADRILHTDMINAVTFIRNYPL